METPAEPTEEKLPDDILTKLKSNIWNLFNCKRVCGVCLNKTRNLRLGNTIYSISCGENLSEKSLVDIISSIFGNKVTTLLPTIYFCESCIDVILQAYKMLEEIKFNHHILQYYTSKLSDQLKMKLPDDVHSIVFELDYPNDSKTEWNTNSCQDDDTNDNDCGVDHNSDSDDHTDESGNEKNEIKDDKVNIKNDKVAIKNDKEAIKNDKIDIKKDKVDIKNETLKSEKVEIEIDIKKETKQIITRKKKVTSEINEIMNKIKGQITVKKVKNVKNEFKVKSVNLKKIVKKAPKKPVVKVETPVLGKNSKELLDMKNKRYYKCYLCETTFTGENELLKHSRKLCIEFKKNNLMNIQREKSTQNITNDPNKEVCDQCGKVVASNYLIKHKKLHEFVQKQCPVCAQFINKASYNRHMESHSGQPKLRHCPSCDYVTRFTETLDAHVNKVHLHVRPYTCNVCNKSFHSKLLLREHVKIHTRSKTEQCDVCGDRFSYKKSLVLHMRIHTGYKPYKCDVCDESFLSSSRRQIHKQRKHSARNFQCDICLKKFFIRSTLKAHLLKVHGKKNKENNS